MYNIVLVCEHGASTGMLTTRMQEAAKNLGVDATINAYSFTALGEVIDGADIVLLGPQVRFRKKIFEEQYADKGVEFVVIDTVDYGRMNGEKIIKTTLEYLNNKK